MRKTKFRAWDREKQRMIQPFVELYKYGVEYYEYVNSKCLEIMEFTGLCDVNNKEIYEGDILKSAWEYSVMDSKSNIIHKTDILYQVVMWDTLMCGYVLCHHDEMLPSHKDYMHTSAKEEFSKYTIDTHDVVNVVVGNIYENKELLNES